MPHKAAASAPSIALDGGLRDQDQQAMAGRALGVLLAVAIAALLVAAARAADEPWKCFRSCAHGCHHHGHHNNGGSSATAADFFPSGSGDAASNVSAVTAECKNGCHEDACYKDLPAISHRQCAIATCLSHPHHNRKTMECLKDCCDKCFHKKPPAPPGPPKPGPKPGPPTPSPPTPGPSPPEPSPPTPGPPPPEPGPGPLPPSPPEPYPGPTPPSPPN